MALGDELTYRDRPRAVVVPARGQSHIKPCMLLARALAALGFEAIFTYFSFEYAKLAARKQLPEPGFNAHPEGTADLGAAPFSGSGGGGRSRLLHTLRIEKGFLSVFVVEDEFSPDNADKPFFCTPAMQENLFDLILEHREQGRTPTCLIADLFSLWTQQVAERAGIPCISFCVSNAMAYLLAHITPLLFSQAIFPEKGPPTQWKRGTPLMLDLLPGLPPISSDFYPPAIRTADASNPMVSFLRDLSVHSKHSERMLFHTLSELEPDAFSALQGVGVTAYAIGPLFQHYDAKPQEDSGAAPQAEECALQPTPEVIDCIAWLDSQEESSVIYISFGGVASVPGEDLRELALGLEACGSTFLWVIRNDVRGGRQLSEILPDGFLERTSEKGMIIEWAPQMEVLAHKAVGGFLSHCGWNSTLESLWEGVPMLCCPIGAEQFSNANYVCNMWGVGVELGRTDTGGFERRNVEVGVKCLMQEEGGLRARTKAQEVKALARKTCQQGGQSFSNLQKFYDDMKELCRKE